MTITQVDVLPFYCKLDVRSRSLNRDDANKIVSSESTQQVYVCFAIENFFTFPSRCGAKILTTISASLPSTEKYFKIFYTFWINFEANESAGFFLLLDSRTDYFVWSRFEDSARKIKSWNMNRKLSGVLCHSMLLNHIANVLAMNLTSTLCDPEILYPFWFHSLLIS